MLTSTTNYNMLEVATTLHVKTLHFFDIKEWRIEPEQQLSVQQVALVLLYSLMAVCVAKCKTFTPSNSLQCLTGFLLRDTPNINLSSSALQSCTHVREFSVNSIKQTLYLDARQPLLRASSRQT